jgi:hypothetical protein
MVPVVTSKGQLTPPWIQLFTNLFNLLNQGYPAAKTVGTNQQPQSVTITTAKLTGGGTNGSMTFTNGLLTGSTQAT